MEYEKLYWDRRYKNGETSGYGSYGDQLEKKLKWLTPLDFQDVTEIGCGDFNFGGHLMFDHPLTEYYGYDISKVIIDRNKKLFPQYTFLDLNEDPYIMQSDLLLCMDVLFHVIEDADAENLLSLLQKNWTKYLALTAYERDEEVGGHVRIRKFDPSRFGKPVIREVIEENGQLYFYLFKK